ncbi:Putative SOS response-associated peptidase YedK [Filimonas lacunae]|uniref:Abasic site processing protein n=1 Tax=Filimonas lacunae TaxID=477680 RepID=A0A173MG97_9BACT|nr:hypothetical protein FLA_2642 [Filimonas lacunae]SIT27628.1 Putative SOS response-associated peptidase YedK [Filimonas lacunae]
MQAQAYQPFPIITNNGGQLTLQPFEWGVIPDYFKTPEDVKKGRSFMCNAQSEKIIDDTRSFWRRIRQHRCLIPVTGIYEHRNVTGFKNKIPYHVQLRQRSLFCLPGLFHYSPFANKETGELTGTFTIITRAANRLMRQIHNNGPNSGRMPLFLTKELELQWLQEGLNDMQIQEILHYEMPAEEMQYYTVHTIRTTKPRPDDKRKTEPFEWLNLPELEVV